MKVPAINKTILILSLLLLLPALLINLGLLAFLDDEGIRSLVALEMQLTGNYITPTLLGEFYYNKPPLYNWILLGFFILTGEINEWTARIPTVFFLLLYAISVFFVFKKYVGKRLAWLTAFSLITCGRIFFFDSMLGLIDIGFSWLTFMGFVVIFREYNKRAFLLMFLGSYLIAAAGFLMKGLPSIVFQGLTISAFLVYKREFRLLFSLKHLAGIAVFLLVTGTYFFVYSRYNSLEGYLPNLIHESTKRTPMNFNFWDTLKHLLSFPFEMVYHFLPWSLFIIYLFKRSFFRIVRSNDFLVFCLLVILVNIPVYWSSVKVFPRYLLMFPPFFFGV